MKADPSLRWPGDMLGAAGLPGKDIKAWLAALPQKPGTFTADRKAVSAFWQKSSRLLEKLPPGAKRNDPQHMAASYIADQLRESRVRLLQAHVDTVYDALTAKRTRFVRLEDLVPAAAKFLPGLVPSQES